MNHNRKQCPNLERLLREYAIAVFPLIQPYIFKRMSENPSIHEFIGLEWSLGQTNPAIAAVLYWHFASEFIGTDLVGIFQFEF